MEKRTGIVLSLAEGLAVERDVRVDQGSDVLAELLGSPHAYLLRCGVDARGKGEPRFVVTALVGDGADAPQAPVPLGRRPIPPSALAPGEPRPLVCGAGPAGLFAALELAERGLRPYLIERGAPVEERRADVAAFRRTRVLDTQSNVQFGEGGAGTFSDGKLTCGKHSPHTRAVLETFVAAGAPASILWQAKPHIGTDILGDVVREIRHRIEACGGTVRFHTQLAALDVRAGRLRGVRVVPADGGAPAPCPGVAASPDSDAAEYIACNDLILAIGHSARDTFNMLKGAGLALEPKAFSIGVRIEHLQDAIGRAQYGEHFAHPALGAADYKLNVHLKNGRGVYTFCMCPGGEVVAASSEEGMLCVNGMSEHARAGRNANAALLCSVVPEDFRTFADAGDPLAGVAFQRHWERAAFSAGGGNWCAPAQTVGEYLAFAHGVAHPRAQRTRAASPVEPSYPLGVREADLRSCLPAFASSSLAEALPLLGRKLRGFDAPEALLTGIEARSSSPVRILRNRDTLQAECAVGLYPCGEGAGYAGGIMSAALDGIACARALCAQRVAG